MEYNQNLIDAYDMHQDRINKLEAGIGRASNIKGKYQRQATRISILIQCALYDAVEERDQLI